MKSNLDYHFWQRGIVIAGVDEVGRGALAGPVVAVAVVLPKFVKLNGVKDSKELTPKQRLRLFAEIKSQAISYGIGIVNHRWIDRINIKNAAFKAMKKAINQLNPKPHLILVDGFAIPDLPIKNRGIIKGDQRSLSIASASILAKVIRDEIMNKFHNFFPEYNFKKHKGYPTKQHLQILKRFGPCPIHRRSYQPVRNCLER